MARAQSTDFMQNFRFHATIDVVDDEDVLSFETEDKHRSEAGFKSITMPEYSTDAAEYRDGITNHTMKQPSFPTVNELTFERGVVLQDTAFLDWALRAFDNSEYRADIRIMHFGKDAMKPDYTGAEIDPSKGRVIKIYQAFPIRVKPAADLDADGTDITLQEMDVQYEWFEIETP